MRNSILMILSILSLTGMSGQPLVARPMPSFTTKELSGKTVTLSASQITKPTLFVFWATWCDVCIREMPAIKELYKTHGKDIDIIGINIDDDLETPRKLTKKMQIEFQNLFDDKGEISRAFKVTSTPAMFAVDSQGDVVKSGHRVKEFTTLLVDLASKNKTVSN